MKRAVLVVTLLAALLAGALAPSTVGTVSASSQVRSHPALFDKTRFVFHLGLAYFAFHHFVYTRYKNGEFKAGASGRTRHIIEAGVALVFTAHELSVAYGIAKSCHSHVLCVLSKPLSSLVNKSNTVGNKLKGGQFSQSEVSDVINSANGFSQQATKNGISIKDIKIFVPGQS